MAKTANDRAAISSDAAISSPRLAAMSAAMWRGVYKACTGVLKGVLCIGWLVPAVLVNLDMARDKGPAWTALAVASVAGGAVAVEAAREMRGVAGKALCCLVAAIILSFNVSNAIRNGATHRGDLRDNRLSQQKIAADIAAKTAAMQQRRQAQVDIAGEAAPEALTAELSARKSQDANRWTATDGCKPELITAGASRAFCNEVGKIEVRLAASRKREELDLLLQAIAPQGGVGVLTSADPGTDSLAAFIAVFGYSTDEAGKSLLAASADWQGGVVMELLAALFPAFTLMLLERWSAPGAAGEAAPVPCGKPARASKEKPRCGEPEIAEAAPEPVAAADGDAEIGSFYAARIEPVQGETVQPKPLYDAWVEFCAETAIEPGSARAFSLRIQRRVGYDRNKRRPRYLNVRLKPNAPRLRLAASR
jgi:hypothetical protein